MQFNLCFNIYSNSLTQKDKKVKLRARIFRFPDARVRGKHSARQSTRDRAEARTHYPQRNGTQKHSSEREGDRDSGGRSLRDFGVLISFIVTRSPSVAFGASSLPEGAFVHHTSAYSGFELLPDSVPA